MDSTTRLLDAINRMTNRVIVNNRRAYSYIPEMQLQPSEIHMIDQIGSTEEMNITTLAEQNGVTKGAISKQISRLEGKGLVERYQTPDNRKNVLVRLTDLGWRAYSAHKKFHENQDDAYMRAFESYSPQEQQLILDFLDLYSQTLAEYRYPDGTSRNPNDHTNDSKEG